MTRRRLSNSLNLFVFGILSIISVSCLANSDSTTLLEQQLNQYKNSPIIIDASEQTLDIKNNTLTFFKNVEVKQGTLYIKADTVTVTKNNNNNTDKLIAVGKPATFSQVLDDGQQVTAAADNIIYKVNDGRLILKGNANIIQNDSEVSGAQISYDITSQKLLATSDEQNSRVRTVLTPRG